MAYVQDRGKQFQGRRWRVRWRGPDGAEHAKSFALKGDADRYCRDVATRLDRGDHVDPARGKVTIREWGDLWLSTLQPPVVKPSTYESYKSLLTSVVYPTFGEWPLASIRQSDVTAWVAGLASSGMSASRVRQAHGQLAKLLDAAVGDERISRNRARGVKLPALPKRPRRRYLTHEQVHALAAASKTPDLVFVLGYCGLRFGEAAALDVADLVGNRLIVRRSVTEINGRHVWGTPKGGEPREVPVPAFLREILRVSTRGRSGPMFPAPNGGIIRRGNWRRRSFDPAVEATGLGPLSPHDLRHTAASLAISAGANVLVVARMLGHADPAVTLSVYAELFSDDLDTVADALDEAASKVHLGAKVTRLRLVRD